MNIEGLYNIIEKTYLIGGKWGPLTCYDSTIYEDSKIYDVYINRPIAEKSQVTTFSVHKRLMVEDKGKKKYYKYDISIQESNYQIAPTKEELFEKVKDILRDIKLTDLGI